jgi:hypothetical protein
MRRGACDDYFVTVISTPSSHAWRWHIHRKGRRMPVQRSPERFLTKLDAEKAGEDALRAFNDALKLATELQRPQVSL